MTLGDLREIVKRLEDELSHAADVKFDLGADKYAEEFAAVRTTITNEIVSDFIVERVIISF